MKGNRDVSILWKLIFLAYYLAHFNYNNYNKAALKVDAETFRPANLSRIFNVLLDITSKHSINKSVVTNCCLIINIFLYKNWFLYNFHFQKFVILQSI